MPRYHHEVNWFPCRVLNELNFREAAAMFEEQLSHPLVRNNCLLLRVTVPG